MKKEDLIALKKELSELSSEEQKQRDLYLRGLANGEIEGPPVGYSSIDKPWLKWYKKENIDLTVQNQTVFENFCLETEEYGNPVLLEYYGKKYTRANIQEEVIKNMKALLSKGLKTGDTISLIMLNTPEAMFLWYAANQLGIVTNMIKFDESAERINFMVSSTESKQLFVSEIPFIVNNVRNAVDMGSSLEEIILVGLNESLSMKNVAHLVNLESKINYYSSKSLSPTEKIPLYELIKMYKKTIQESKSSDQEIFKMIGDDKKYIKYVDFLNSGKNIADNFVRLENPEQLISSIVYTGGTTGNPKGVKLTNQNINSMAHAVKYGDSKFSIGQQSLNILPPAIAYYYNATHANMCCGVKVHLVSHFTPTTYPYLINQYKPNNFMSGPILLENMRKSNAISDTSYMLAPISGGDKLSVEEEMACNEWLARLGSSEKVHQGYGMSECTAVATYATTNSNKVGSVGVPIINVNVGIFDYQNDTELPYNSVGEICISGPTIMEGYNGNSAATSNVLKKHSDGTVWLHTDDFGMMDEEGRLFHRGRAKRMITRAGNKVWMTSIENVAEAHESIEKCCCVKKEDSEEREIPLLYLVLKNYNDTKIEELINSLKSDIENKINIHHVPKYFAIVDDLPYSEVNKKVDLTALEKENLEDSDVYQNIVDGVYVKKAAQRKSLKKIRT